MAKQSFKFFTPRDKPKKRRRVHKKSKNKLSDKIAMFPPSVVEL